MKEDGSDGDGDSNSIDNEGDESEEEEHETESVDDVALEKDEEINAFRNKMQIKARGESIPKPCAIFRPWFINCWATMNSI